MNKQYYIDDSEFEKNLDFADKVIMSASFKQQSAEKLHGVTFMMFNSLKPFQGKSYHFTPFSVGKNYFEIIENAGFERQPESGFFKKGRFVRWYRKTKGN